MSQAEDAPQKTGWGELGHKWITAIAGLITALAGAGFFLGRSTAPETPSSPDANAAAPVTVTVTVPAGNDPGTEASTAPVDTDSDLRWEGKLNWNGYGTGYNLDLVPPTYTDGRYLSGTLTGLESYGDAAQIAVWKSGSFPGRADCAEAVDTEGTDHISTLEEGNQVCGRTYEGRVFRLEVIAAGSDFKAEGVVWEK
ncbi:hypothetical protein FFT09_07070 [Saccharomonospora piscinae]|uniref:hypothetical protein n=1 Tax=Saccharomonospora piscinae TaxID=687388 RepID=UPI0011062CB9|nr:hypothetical protein [Saccharomonospora piscinae]TLW93175.1 hypothetical protein FFT09_07070 [Saccharomonospora piscinae]